MAKKFFSLKLTHILFYAGIACLIFHTTASANRAIHELMPIILNPLMEKYPVGLHIEYLEDKEKKIHLNDILYDQDNVKKRLKWTASYQKTLGFGFTSSVYWIHFGVKNTLPDEVNWSLELDYSHIDKIDIYRFQGGKQIDVRKAGDHYPFRERELIYRNFVFQFNEKPESSSEYYIRFETSSSMNIPLWIWTPSILAEKINNEQILLGLYYGIIIIIAIYNLFILLFIKDLNYLYYILWVVGYGMYQITINGLAFQYFWPNSIWWANISLPFFICFGTTWSLQFGRSFLNTKKNTPLLDKYILILMLCTLSGAVASFIVPYSLIIRYGTAMVIIMVITMLISGLQSLYKGYRAARFYVFAWTSLLIGVAVFALMAFGLLPENFFTMWSQQIGSAIEVTLLSLALADRISVINQEKKQAQLEKIKAQEKYKLLVEGSNDIIFSLDEKWRFITVNEAIRTHLKINPESMESKSFFDLIYEDIDRGSVTRNLINEKLELFSKERKPLEFKTELKSFIGTEPKEMRIRLEYINIEGKEEILGKASNIQEDALIKYFESEQISFSIGNYLITADDISYHITRNLHKFIDNRQINLLRIGIREIIINAIEHGNLEISFDEKSAALEDNSYFDFIAKRQRDPNYSNRRVKVEYCIDSNKIVVKIADEGKGFDYRILFNEVKMNLALHGRGIAMTRNVFDVVKYNQKGNEVELTKYF